MKIKKEYLILFLIIAVLVLYITLRKGNRIQYEIPEVTELTPDSISGIIIQGNNSKTVLTKEDDKWLIGPDKYVADSYKIEKMINFLKKPVLMTVVSDSKDYMRYGLDDKNRIIVKALSGDTPKRMIEIGYHTDVRNYTFIKLEDDYRVYQAREDLRDIFSTDIDDIRDKTVLSFNVQEVENIYLTRDGKELAFNKKEMPSEGEEGKTVIQWETGDGKKIEAALMHSLLDDILGIKCAEYIYDINEGQLGDPAYVIRIRDKNDHVLTVYPKLEEDFRAVSSDNPTPFSLYSWRIDNVIEKFDKMLGEGDKKEAESD
ncbi:MAG: DUF4340 domain-containing protein [Desulfobacteraceae bacterium]|jgi:hypothetical protein